MVKTKSLYRRNVIKRSGGGPDCGGGIFQMNFSHQTNFSQSHHAKKYSSSGGIGRRDRLSSFLPSFISFQSNPSESPSVKKILLPGGRKLHQCSPVSFFVRIQGLRPGWTPRSNINKRMNLKCSTPQYPCNICNDKQDRERERLPLEQKLSSTPQNLLDREMEKTPLESTLPRHGEGRMVGE